MASFARRLWGAITGLCVVIPFNEEVCGVDFPVTDRDECAMSLALRPTLLNIVARATNAASAHPQMQQDSIYESGQDVIFVDHRLENRKAIGRIVGTAGEVVVLSQLDGGRIGDADEGPAAMMERLRSFRRIPDGAVALRDREGRVRLIHGPAVRGAVLATVIEGLPIIEPRQLKAKLDALLGRSGAEEQAINHDAAAAKSLR